MCKYVKCWCVADDSSEYKRQVYTKSGGYSLNYGTDPPKWRAGAILCNKERYCSYMSSNLPLSFHWPYISPRRVASMNFCRRLWKSSGSFLFIWIVSMRTLRYNSGNELKFFQRGSSCFKASNISGIISNSLAGYWARPASVILPRSSILLHLALFSSDHIEPLRRGTNLWRVMPSSNFLVMPSIQPKHIASSTASTYQNVEPSSTGIPRLTAIQHSFSVSWLTTSHFRNSSRSLISRTLFIMIYVIPFSSQ